jgi:hypothetical protein
LPPGTLEGLGVVLVAVVPGYIAVTLWARSKTWERPPTDLRLILLAIVFSAVIQALLFPLTVPWLWPIRNHLIEHPVRVGFWAVTALIAIPALGGIYGGRLTDLFFGARRASLDFGWAALKRVVFASPVELLPPVTPSAWDGFLLEQIPRGRILVITMDEGKVIAGSYYAGSFAKTTPQKQGIFLNREWTVDEHHRPVSPIATSRGVLVPAIDKIKHVRVFVDPRREGDSNA